jgi:hypothetical protein
VRPHSNYCTQPFPDLPTQHFIVSCRLTTLCHPFAHQWRPDIHHCSPDTHRCRPPLSPRYHCRPDCHHCHPDTTVAQILIIFVQTHSSPRYSPLLSDTYHCRPDAHHCYPGSTVAHDHRRRPVTQYCQSPLCFQHVTQYCQSHHSASNTSLSHYSSTHAGTDHVM